MKRKVLSIILCSVWVLICFFGVFVPKEYMTPLPDELSEEYKPAPSAIIEFHNDMRIKVYREDGKYFMSSESLIYETEPEIVELTKSEYRYCTRVDAYRLENQMVAGSFEYSICVKKGGKEEKYKGTFQPSPLYEMERIKDIKDGIFNPKDDLSKRLVRLESFLDEGKFDMAYLSYPSGRIDGFDSYYYKNAACKEYNDKWYDLYVSYKAEQGLNMFLFKQYEKGNIELKDINLKASLDKKEEMFARVKGNLSLGLLARDSYNYKSLLSPDDKPITSESKQIILDETTKKISGYDHAAYEYVEYGKNNYCVYELYLPNENETYVLIVKKPFLMPKWYLKWAVNTIILSDKMIISPGLIYQIVLFIFLTIPICFVVKVLQKKL